MKRSISSGIIPFRKTRGKREYLLLKSRADDWEFPKGGVEDGEELQQTALREVSEETGIEKIKLIDGFRDDYSYEFQAGPDTIHKTVHLFIGRSYSANASLSSEHSDYQWRTFEQAKNTVTHQGPKRILERADEFLERKEI